VLSDASKKLIGLPLTVEAIKPVIDSAQSEFDPISDVRGDETYKRLLARQLLWVHFQMMMHEKIDEGAFDEALR
jgi:xanthine dehydrogenase small subunit